MMTHLEPEPPKPEDLDDKAWSDLLERVEADATEIYLAERERLVAAGVINSEGRPLKEPMKEVRRDDGGGW
jgi:hypothetical protein